REALADRTCAECERGIPQGQQTHGPGGAPRPNPRTPRLAGPPVDRYQHRPGRLSALVLAHGIDDGESTRSESACARRDRRFVDVPGPAYRSDRSVAFTSRHPTPAGAGTCSWRHVALLAVRCRRAGSETSPPWRPLRIAAAVLIDRRP